MIEVTVKNEQQLIAQFRDEMMKIARRAVADSPDRIGKRYANVTIPQLRIESYTSIDLKLPIDWV